ncbi:MAG TPA: hypothetical protein PKA05_13695 [Roseiflexaceae bacterium]|nr:hypothetical protein [Roseiflexaceae bacterium]
MVFPQEALLLLLVVLIVAVLTILHHGRALAAGRPANRRPLPALQVMQQALGRGAETGRAIHISPGSGGVGGRIGATETVAGLLAAERVATEAALSGAPVLASSGDAVTHLAMIGALRQAHHRAGIGQDFDPELVQLLSQQDPMAYASGVTTLYSRQMLEASQLIGSFGQEFILAGEFGATRGVPQVAGATATVAQPLVYLAADGALIGEEVYAAEAYLTSEPAPQARLFTQDTLRTVVIVSILLLMVLSAAGVQFAF